MTLTVGVMVKETHSKAQLGSVDDLEAFERIYEDHAEAIFRHAFYLLGHHEDADDVKQETFLRAYRALHSFRRESSVRTWLRKICSNLCYDRLKRNRQQRELLCEPEEAQRALVLLSTEVTGDPLTDPQAALDRADTLRLLLCALQGLPPPQRNVIVLHVLEGLDYREIGEILGCAPGSAKMRVLRATQLFRERVKAMGVGR